jgi:hypothetical protein
MSPIDIDDVILVWADLLTTLPPATRAAAQEAQPLSVEDNVITFGIPKALEANARSRFKKEADTIRDALSSRLGRRMMFSLKTHDGFTASATRSASRAEVLVPDDEVLDITELVDADGDDAAVDSVGLAAKRLDATIVEELPRD